MYDLEPLQALRARFPAAFAWGVASSAFQIEGASTADDRGPSIWDEFCRRPGTIADGTDGTVACDHYHRLESALDLIAALGIGAYRFSIAWPRVHPSIESGVVAGSGNMRAEPSLTLDPWDLPAALQPQHNDWADRQTVFRF